MPLLLGEVSVVVMESIAQNRILNRQFFMLLPAYAYLSETVFCQFLVKKLQENYNE